MNEAPSVEAKDPAWHAEISFGKPDDEAGSVSDAVRKAISSLDSRDAVDAIGHRVVHGGNTYTQSVRIDDNVIKEIERLQEFAPLHNKLNLDGIRTSITELPNAKQFAVFDTSFHRTIPDHAALYPIPYDFYENKGIKRYGFHGINHEYVTHRAAALLKMPVSDVNLITCHLGSGCSISTVSGGVCIDNTMGFTPLEGLMMGTRCGSIDPGVILRLVRESGDVDSTDKLLNKQSGLLGVSGVSNDMRQILQSAKAGHGRAQLALNMFIYRLQSAIGAAAAHLRILDAIVFTAGIGEHAAEVRLRACEALHNLDGIIDHVANESAHPDCNIAIPTSKVAILVITAREDWQIARESYRLAHT